MKHTIKISLGLLSLALLCGTSAFADQQARTCSGSYQGKDVTLTITGANSVSIAGLTPAPTEFTNLHVDSLNSTDILTQFKSSDKGGLTLVIQKVGGIPADATVESPRLGNFALPTCSF